MRPRGALGGQGAGPCARKPAASPAPIQFNIIYIMRTLNLTAKALQRWACCLRLLTEPAGSVPLTTASHVQHVKLV